MTTTAPDAPELWPAYDHPSHLAVIERTPLDQRGLPVSTWQVLTRAALLWPDRPAAHVLPDGARYDRPRTITYAGLADAAARAADSFRSLGVTRHDVVGLLSPNTAELIPALLGAQAAGIAAPVNPILRPAEVVDLLERARVKVLVAAGPALHAELWQAARDIAARLNVAALFALRPTAGAPDVPALEPVAGIAVRYLDPFAELSTTAPDQESVSAPDPALLPTGDDLAAFFHTGGTTATPKIAAHTHAMEVADAWAVAAGVDPGEGTTTFAGLPLFHVNAVVVTLLAPMLRGRAVVWAGPLGYRDPDLVRTFWKTIERYRVAGMSGVPTVYETLTRVPVDADVSSLQVCIVGAAPLARTVAERWAQHTGVPLCEGYGLTEATCASARNLIGHLVEGSVGQRLPYQQIKAVQVDPASGQWHDLPPGSVGTLAIRGPVVFPGYLVGHNAYGPVLDGMGRLRDGWLDTGDLGSVGEDGYVRLTGRAKDLIIRGGHNIDPVVIEDALRSHPQVRDAAAVGRPDPHSGEVPVAYVILTDTAPDDHGVSEDELLAWAKDRVPEPAAVPKAVTVVPSLPMTAVGKLHKVPLREDAARRELAGLLTRQGVTLPADDTWCEQLDGQLTVTISVDPGVQDKVREILGRYAVAVRITSSAPAAP